MVTVCQLIHLYLDLITFQTVLYNVLLILKQILVVPRWSLATSFHLGETFHQLEVTYGGYLGSHRVVSRIAVSSLRKRVFVSVLQKSGASCRKLLLAHLPRKDENAQNNALLTLRLGIGAALGCPFLEFCCLSTLLSSATSETRATFSRWQRVFVRRTSADFSPSGSRFTMLRGLTRFPFMTTTVQTTHLPCYSPSLNLASCGTFAKKLPGKGYF